MWFYYRTYLHTGKHIRDTVLTLTYWCGFPNKFIKTFTKVTVHKCSLKYKCTETLFAGRNEISMLHPRIPCTYLSSWFLCGLSEDLQSLYERPVLPEIMHCAHPGDKTMMWYMYKIYNVWKQAWYVQLLLNSQGYKQHFQSYIFQVGHKPSSSLKIMCDIKHW